MEKQNQLGKKLCGFMRANTMIRMLRAELENDKNSENDTSEHIINGKNKVQKAKKSISKQTVKNIRPEIDQPDSSKQQKINVSCTRQTNFDYELDFLENNNNTLKSQLAEILASLNNLLIA